MGRPEDLCSARIDPDPKIGSISIKYMAIRVRILYTNCVDVRATRACWMCAIPVNRNVVSKGVCNFLLEANVICIK